MRVTLDSSERSDHYTNYDTVITSELARRVGTSPTLRMVF